MPKTVSLQIGHPDGSIEDFGFAFTTAEWALLVQFATEYDCLSTAPCTKAVFGSSVSIQWSVDIGWHPVDPSTAPSTDDLAAFLHRLRPIILAKEPASFQRAMEILEKYTQPEPWKPLGNRFDGQRYESIFTISITPIPIPGQDPRALVLNSGHTLHKWLNAFEYHRDAKKAALFEEVYDQGFPTPDHIRGLMIELLIEKVIAAGELREVIRVLQTGPGASFTIRGK